MDGPRTSWGKPVWLSPGWCSQLAGMASLKKIASIQSVVTGNNTPPYAMFSYNESTRQTIYTYIDGTTVKSYPILTAGHGCVYEMVESNMSTAQRLDGIK